MAGHSDLCYDPGLKFAELVHRRFGCTVSPPTPLSPSGFHLVTSFGRSAVHLNEDSVSLILQACLGGTAKNYNVLHLSGWMYSFTVSCKDIGFMVHRLRSFSCKTFAIFFFLWSRGGPNWRKEFALWTAEQEAEWTLVGSKNKKKSYAEIVQTPAAPKKSVFVRLDYPSNYHLNYLKPVLDPRPPTIQSSSNSKSVRTQADGRKSGRILRWVPKLKGSASQAFSQPAQTAGNSNSKSASPTSRPPEGILGPAPHRP